MPYRRTPAELNTAVPGFDGYALANLWKAERLSRGWTQDDVAERVYTSRQNVGKWENKGETPALIDAALLASAYDLSLDDVARRVGLPVGTPASAEDAARANATLAGAVRLLLASNDTAWRDGVIDRLHREVIAHEARRGSEEGSGYDHAELSPKRRR